MSVNFCAKFHYATSKQVRKSMDDCTNDGIRPERHFEFIIDEVLAERSIYDCKALFVKGSRITEEV